MSVSMSLDHATKTVELSVKGSVTEEDWAEIVPDFIEFMEAHGTIKLIEIVESFEGFDPGLIWKGVRLDMKVVPHISHCAVVSDIAWISPLVKAVGALMPIQLRTFARADLDAARDWLARAEPVRSLT